MLQASFGTVRDETTRSLCDGLNGAARVLAFDIQIVYSSTLNYPNIHLGTNSLGTSRLMSGPRVIAK